MTLTCGKKIELTHTGLVVTYCILKQGHDGPCKPDELLAQRYSDVSTEGKKAA